jgi:hypothetical protein
MSNFACEKCGVTQFDSATGYVSGCCHYPPHHSRFVTIDYGGGCEAKAFHVGSWRDVQPAEGQHLHPLQTAGYFGAWYKSKEAQAKHQAVHPVTWREQSEVSNKKRTEGKQHGCGQRGV